MEILKGGGGGGYIRNIKHHDKNGNKRARTFEFSFNYYSKKITLICGTCPIIKVVILVKKYI